MRGLPVRIYEYDEEKIWPENADFQMIFQKDVAYELGAGKATSANLTCVTDDPELFKGEQEQLGTQGLPEGSGTARDQILVYGQDLQEIQGDGGAFVGHDNGCRSRRVCPGRVLILP